MAMFVARDLAQGLVDAIDLLGRTPSGLAFRVVSRAGEEIVRGGALDRDGEPRFLVEGDELTVHDLAAGRAMHACAVVTPESEPAWLVLTQGARRDRERLRGLAALFGRLLERDALRDYEAEDTTRHLLSCFEQIRAVHDLADRLPACESTEQMGRLCLESLLLAVGVRTAVLVLRQERSDQADVLRLGASGVLCQETTSIDVAEGTGPLTAAFRDGKVRYGPVTGFAIPANALEAQAAECLLVVPICFGSGSDLCVLGAFVLMDRPDSDRAKVPFGNPDAELAQSVSVLLGLAIGTRMRAAAEKELQLARAIQETLVPARAPAWHGVDLAGRNSAANQVGGDYFDFLESGDGRRHVIIADVSGHNMASAMAMVMLRSQLRALLTRESSPASIVGQLTSGLFEDLVRNELFITVFFLTVVEQGPYGTRVRYTNAGHNPPLLLRADGSLQWLEEGGPMVGFLPEVDYEQTEVLLEPGDLIVMYTDGVTEVTNMRGQMLEEEGLRRVVTDLAAGSAGEILGGIFQAVHDHARANLGEDDVTAVVVKATSGERGAS